MAQEWEDRQMFGDETARQTIRVLSSTDTSFFLPIINSFVAKNPNIGVEYLVSGTANIDEIYRQTPDTFDVIISSAMDLQLKLVNDGFAQNLDGIQNPDWAQWRESLYAFTAERGQKYLETALALTMFASRVWDTFSQPKMLAPLKPIGV